MGIHKRTKLESDLVHALEGLLERVQDCVRDRLVPDVLSWPIDDETGLILPTGVDAGHARKSLLVQAGALYTLGTMMRYAFEPEASEALGAPIVEALEPTFWDDQRTGWFDEAGGDPGSKSGAGHGLTLAALCEFVMATGSFRASELAVETVQAVQIFLANNASGGYYGTASEFWEIEETDENTRTANVLLLLGFDTARQAWGTELYARKHAELISFLDVEAIETPVLRDVALGCLHEFPTTADPASQPLRAALELWSLSGNPLYLKGLGTETAIEYSSRSADTGDLEDELARILAPVGLMRCEELLLRALY